jgi:gamma-glutamyl:cysteine ligase YbdK (ATP-grasp superfamily)
MTKERTKQHENSHKDMVPTDPYQFEDGMSVMDKTDLSLFGGILLTYHAPTHYAKHPDWRAEKGDPVLRQADVRELKYVYEHPDYTSLMGGGELEVWARDPNSGDIYPIMASDSPVRAALEHYNGTNGNGFHFHDNLNAFEEEPGVLGFSDELSVGQIELNFEPFANGRDRAIHQFKVLRRVAAITKQHGAQIMPIGTLAHRPLRPEDVNPNKYVTRIAMEHMGWERVQHFLGGSFQVHAEMFDIETAMRSINYLQQVEPFSLALSASAPFVHSKIFINDEQIPGIGSQQSTWQSVRYPGRLAGSPNGGPIEFPAPDTTDEYYVITHKRLKKGEIPTAARGLGNHVDLRFRPDLLTIEMSIDDNFAAHPLKLAAFSEYKKAKAFKIQVLIHEGREDELPNDLFKKLNQEGIERAKRNALEVSKIGIDAIVEKPDGETWTTAGIQEERLLNWVIEPELQANYHGLPDGVIKEIEKSRIVLTEEEFAQYGPDSDNFIYGFYQSGLGTPSQWLHRRAKYLLENGASEQEAVDKCIEELSIAFHRYMDQPDVEGKINEMFKDDPNF